MACLIPWNKSSLNLIEGKACALSVLFARGWQVFKWCLREFRIATVRFFPLRPYSAAGHGPAPIRNPHCSTRAYAASQPPFNIIIASSDFYLILSLQASSQYWRPPLHQHRKFYEGAQGAFGLGLPGIGN